jgi:uroporphyrinogen-III synthase
VFFSSPSAILSFAGNFPPEVYRGLKTVCIGESTARQARKFGMETWIPPETSGEGMYRLAEELLKRNP